MAAFVRALSFAFTAFLFTGAACGGGAGATRPDDGPVRPLPAYTSRDAILFDDAIEPDAVGYDLGGADDPNRDVLFRERAQVGDIVVRARVTTVTSKDEDTGQSWQIGLHTLEPLSEDGPPAKDLTLEVGPRGRAAGILRAWNGRLIGTVFIVFARRYARRDSPEDAMLHFHVVKDGAGEQAAVRAALAGLDAHVR